jgi:hypothetical protein
MSQKLVNDKNATDPELTPFVSGKARPAVPPSFTALNRTCVSLTHPAPPPRTCTVQSFQKQLKQASAQPQIAFSSARRIGPITPCGDNPHATPMTIIKQQL